VNFIVILDQIGAETLLKNGDMLFKSDDELAVALKEIADFYTHPTYGI